MKKLFYYGAALAALSVAGAASAHDLNVNFRYGRLPEVRQSWQPDARIIHVDPPLNEADRNAMALETVQWERYCRPEIKRDELGVGHYVYQHTGCEFGRSSE
jgi:hypothetical protein